MIYDRVDDSHDVLLEGLCSDGKGAVNIAAELSEASQ